MTEYLYFLEYKSKKTGEIIRKEFTHDGIFKNERRWVKKLYPESARWGKKEITESQALEFSDKE